MSNKPRFRRLRFLVLPLSALLATVPLANSALLLAATTAGVLPARQSYFNVKGTGFLEKTELIFMGRLVEKKSFWGGDRQVIFTRHLFEVEDAIKGAPQGKVKIIEYGGTVGETTIRLSHHPHYVLGQEYLVFSYIDPDSPYRTPKLLTLIDVNYYN